MAQKEMKMISIEKMDEIMNDYFPAEETVDFHGEELTVQKRIPFALVCEMVKKVADSCFNEDGICNNELCYRCGDIEECQKERKKKCF